MRRKLALALAVLLYLAAIAFTALIAWRAGAS